MSKRGAAVLEAPEQDYAPEPVAPRRTSVTPKRKLRRDFTEDFADDDWEDPLADGGPRPRRGGVRLKLRWGLPRTKWGRIAAGVVALVCVGACAVAGMATRDWLMHDARFVVPSASAIQFVGNVHTTRDQLLNVFGEDVERNIFYVPMAQRRAELEQIPWVANATVMRLLPNHLRVAIVERTPVAFVRDGSRIGLVDANGVLLGMPPGAKGDAHYSFPVVTGISGSDPLSTRAARMQMFEKFTAALEGGGDKALAGVSEVDLSNPEDLRAMISTDGSDILVHFGEDKFLERYEKFEEHLPEWRTLYPKLASVDMRYDTQAVLEMQPGAAQNAGASAARAGSGPAASNAPAAATAAPPAVAPVKAAHPSAKIVHAPVRRAVEKHPAAKNVASKAGAKSEGRVKAVSEVAFSVAAKKAGAKPHARAKAPAKGHAAKHPAARRPAKKRAVHHAAKHSAGTVHP